MTLDIRPVESNEQAEVWRRIHNAIIRTSPLSAEEVQERLTRNPLTLAYLADDVIGNSTIRPATPNAPAIVIVRILPQYRRRGHGTEYWTRLTTEDPTLQGCDLGTVVLIANTDGVRFAESLGFVETDRYDVARVMFVDMTRAA